MNPELPEKLIQEALTAIGYSNDDYLLIASKFHPGTLNFYMQLAFAVGFNEGKKYNFAPLMKPCYAENEQGIIEFDSVRDAARIMKCNHKNIVRAIKTGGKAVGYSWKFV